VQSTSFRGDRQIAIAKPSHEVERFLQRLLLREPKRVVRHALLHRRAHVRRGAEESVGRHQSSECLMRPLEVVALDEERNPPFAVGIVGKHRPRQKLVPKRFPKPLHFAHGLRVLRPALHVPYPVQPQLLLEVRLATPRRVLPALVGENFPRLPIRRDAALERLDDELRPLMVRQVVRHDEARVVVHEGRQVQPLLTPQEKREDVRLPKLVWLGPLEAPRRMLARPRRTARFHKPRLVQNPSHLRLRNAQRLEARQRVSDPTCPVLRMRLAVLHHRRPLHLTPR
jgi:hypothetical protein